jgi:hypothetical protein
MVPKKGQNNDMPEPRCTGRSETRTAPVASERRETGRVVNEGRVRERRVGHQTTSLQHERQREANE